MIKSARKELNRSCTEICQICNKPEILIEHHINGRDIPDFDKFWNLCYICANCHNKIHFNIIVVEGWFMTTDGLKLIYRRLDEDSVTGITSNPPLYVKPDKST